MSQLILVVDDEVNLVKVVRGYLEQAGYRVVTASDGREALFAAREYQPDLIILDLMMPVMDGLAFMREYQREGNAPVIALTARVDETDKVIGLELGADDYITKPFSMEELLFRIEAILRRTKGARGGDTNVWKIGSFTFDGNKQKLQGTGTDQKLTTKESELLILLCKNINQVLERNFTLKAIWIDDNYFNARSMDVYITKLRKYLKPDPNVQIINVHGKGYKLIVDES
jgi:two-component system OmpR family response regulator